MYAVLAARYQKFPRVKIEGLQSLPGPLVMFTSAHVSTSFNHSNETRRSIVVETLYISSFESKTIGRTVERQFEENGSRTPAPSDGDFVHFSILKPNASPDRIVPKRRQIGHCQNYRLMAVKWNFSENEPS